MDFIFFSAADARLFVRDDAESATWTVEELSLQALSGLPRGSESEPPNDPAREPLPRWYSRLFDRFSRGGRRSFP